MEILQEKACNLLMETIWRQSHDPPIGDMFLKRALRVLEDK